VTPRKRFGHRLLAAVARIGGALVAAGGIAFLGAALFIGSRCYSATSELQTKTNPALVNGIAGYTRNEVSTFLTLPEWFIVYSTEEQARFVGTQAPSRFPYVRSIAQFWRYYGSVCTATRGVYPFNAGDHLMLAVIGTSFSVEYGLKGLYEGSIGRLIEWMDGYDTPEDAFAQRTAVEYGSFMHTVPWYEFPFFARLAALWRETPLWGGHQIRKWERRLALSGEYTVKGVYGWLIGRGSKATYGDEDQRVYARIENAGDGVFGDQAIRKINSAGPRAFVISIPRYEAFTGHALTLVRQGVRFVDIAGNDDILISAIGRAEPRRRVSAGSIVLDEPFLTDPGTARLAIKVPVHALHTVVAELERDGVKIEHLYDY
jgi:hypothetical protein